MKVKINPIECCLRSSDQWGTVSNSYKIDIMNKSSLSQVLRNFPKPFSFINGIPSDYGEFFLQHKQRSEAKEKIQNKYFKSEYDPSMCLIVYIGRIIAPKGALLLLESIDSIMKIFNGKVQILLGGRTNDHDAYGEQCVEKIMNVKQAYPQNFWALPTEYFNDVQLLNYGSDFGIIPSVIEPCGLIQQEFFSLGTPVVAHKTGGLKDTIFEFDPKTKKGNGFLFTNYSQEDFLNALIKAKETFDNTQDFAILRENARKSTILVTDAAKAWNLEFHRLSGKLYIDNETVTYQMSKINTRFEKALYVPTNLITKKKGEIRTEKHENMKAYEKILMIHNYTNLRKHTFTLNTNVLPRPKSVFFISNFDDWKVKHHMHFDVYSQVWTFTVNLPPGEYLFRTFI